MSLTSLELAEQALDAEVERNLVARAERLRRINAISDPKVKAQVLHADWSRCYLDPVYWINNWGWVRGEKTKRAELRNTPFVLWPAQEEVVRWFLEMTEASKTALLVKSREMGATWLVLHLRLWARNFRGESSTLGSRKEDLVDRRGDMGSMFEKLRWIQRRQPPHLRDYQTFEKHLVMKNVTNGAELLGESTNEDFHRGGRTAVDAIDEFAAVPPRVAEAVLRAIESACRSAWLWSTPSGPDHPFYSLYQDLTADQVRHLRWDDNPHRPPDFIQQVTRPLGRMTDAQAAQQYGCDFSAIVSGLIFQFNEDAVTYDEMSPDWKRVSKQARRAWPHFGGWDFGSGASLLACIMAVVDIPETGDPVIWIDDELVWQRAGWITAGADTVYKMQAYGGPRLHFGDHAGTHKESDQRSWEMNLRGAGVPLFCLPQWYNGREWREWSIQEAQHLLDSGKIRIHKRCRQLLEALARWRRDVDQFSEILDISREYIGPRKDRYSHPAEAFLYLVAGILSRQRLANRSVDDGGGLPKMPTRGVGQMKSILRRMQ